MSWAPDYITVAELKSYMRIGDAVDDAILALDVTAASRAVDRHCGRQFGKVEVPETRRYTPWFNYRRGVWVAEIDDLQDSTGLTVTVNGVEVTGTLEPPNAIAEGRVFTSLTFAASTVMWVGIEYEVIASAGWGWVNYPLPVKAATRLQASRFASRRSSPYGVAGSPDEGSEIRLLAKVDPDVAVALADFVRPRRAY